MLAGPPRSALPCCSWGWALRPSPSARRTPTPGATSAARSATQVSGLPTGEGGGPAGRQQGAGDMGPGARAAQVGPGCRCRGAGGWGQSRWCSRAVGDPVLQLRPPAGFQMVSRCTDSRDSVCLPCQPGFYNEAVNYDTCRPCTQCNQREAQPPPSAPAPRRSHSRRLPGPPQPRDQPQTTAWLTLPGVPSGASRLPGS